jgi:hypothetical protein
MARPRKTIYNPRRARQGFDDLVQLARWFDMLAKWKASVMHTDDHVSVTLHGEQDGRRYYIHEEGPTLNEAMEAADTKLKEEIAWNRQWKATEARALAFERRMKNRSTNG